MEILFYVGMVIWGLYLVCTESVEDIERDFYGAEYTAAKYGDQIKRPLGYGLYKGGK